MNLFFDIPYKFYDSSVSKGPPCIRIRVQPYRCIHGCMQGVPLCIRIQESPLIIGSDLIYELEELR